MKQAFGSMAACIALGRASAPNLMWIPSGCARPRTCLVRSLSRSGRASTTCSPKSSTATRSSGTLKQLVKGYRRKLFLIRDNGPCHNLKDEGKVWLGRNHHRIELFRLPPYSPNYNPTEGAWKETKKRTTHNRFFRTTDERDAALVGTFDAFKSNPTLLAGHVARFI